MKTGTVSEFSRDHAIIGHDEDASQINPTVAMTPCRFPILLATARRPDAVRSAIETLGRSLASGSIRMVDLLEARSQLGRAVEEAWSARVGTPFFHAGRWTMHVEAIRTLHDQCSPASLSDVLTAHRMLRATRLSGPVVAAMAAVITETLPLAEAADELKCRAVKGPAGVAPVPWSRPGRRCEADAPREMEADEGPSP